MEFLQTFDPPGWRGVVASDAGGGNRDAAWVKDFDGFSLALVIDPKGGIGGGEEATRTILEFLDLAVIEPVFDKVSDLLFLMEQEVVKEGSGGEASLALAMITRRGIFAASVGDSQVWIRQDRTVTRLSGRRKFGSGFEIGTSGLMFELNRFPRPTTHWVALLTDGCAHLIDAPFVDDLVTESAGGSAFLDRIEARPDAQILDSFSLLVHPGRV